MDKGRFSLLLLEPGEIYFEDFSAILVTPDTTIKTYDYKKSEGRLKLCSKSLVFDPKDIQKPLIKIPYKDIQIIEKWKGSNRFIDGENIFRIDSGQHIEMLEGNVTAPYKFCIDGKFIISLNYALIINCLPQITQLMRAATLPSIEQSDMIAVIVQARHAKIKFDPLWMDLYEKIQLECQANKITPLVVNPGRVVLTNSRLYFQPYNNIEINPVVKINLNSIKQIFKRRFLLRHIGLEIYYNETNTKEDHIYISLLNEHERNNLYNRVLEQQELRLSNKDQDMMTLQWQNGIISNYEYLLYINSLGDRTINDLTQYPVFPWIILDYASKTIDLNDNSIYRDLTKPIGALNPDRAKKIAARYEEMFDPKFMYGSHYSTPGFILFYLVRLYPHYMLCLQNGRFDHPDRMFNSCRHLCKNILTDMSDFKELIPEFFDIEQGGSFLVNALGINFGYRHNGVKVDDVQLPAWAESPRHFVRTLRDALESDMVSETLHSWIDLIFGYKQRGDEAVKAKNLFYYLCYEGNVDLDSITDLNQRHTLEVQIMEFGQIPKQVFQVPHPKRRKPLQLLLEPQISVEDSNEDLNLDDVWRNVKSLALKTTFSSHKDKVTCIFITEDGQNIISVGYDFKMKVFSLKQNRQIRSASLGNMPLSCCIKLPNSNILVIGTYGNEIILYDLDFGKITQTVSRHEDAILCLAWASELNLLCSGSGDCTVCAWSGSKVNGMFKPIQYLSHTLDHNSHVTSMCFNPDNDYLAVGTEDGEIYIWNTSDRLLEQKYSMHHGRISAISYSHDGQKLITCSLDKSFQVLDVNTGMPVYKKTFAAALNCLKWMDFLLMLGDADGKLYVWDINAVRLLIEIQAHRGSILTLDISEDKKIIITAGEDSDIKIWTPKLF